MALLLALVFTVGQIAGFAHLAFVRHSRCAEHGELIDVRGGTDRPAVAQSGDTDSPGPRLAQGSSDQDGHRHEHCAAAPQRREKIAATGHAAPGIVSVLRASAVVQRQAPLLPTRAVYRLAPKTSPPA